MAYMTLAAEDEALQGAILDPDAIARSVAWRDVVRSHVGAARAALDEPPIPSVLRRAWRVDSPEDEDSEPEVGAWESRRLSEAQCEIVQIILMQLSAGRLRAYGRRAGPDGVWEWIPRADWQGVKAIEPNVMPWLALFEPLGDTFTLHIDEAAWCDVAVVPCPRDEAYGDLPALPARDAWPGWVRARHDAIAEQSRGMGGPAEHAAAMQCRKWLMAVAAQHVSTKPRGKPWFRDEALRCFGVGPRQFERLWHRVPRSWKLPGEITDAHRALTVPDAEGFARR